MAPRESGTAPGVLAAVGMALAFALELFGAPSCRAGAPLETELRRTDALLADRRGDEALAILLPLREAHPGEAVLDRQVARAYAALNRPAEEASAWEAFLRKSPAPADACVRLGVLLGASGEATRSVVAAEQCLSRDPGQAEVLSQLALAHEALGNQPAADEALERAVRLDSTSPDLLIRSATRLLASGRFAAARERAAAALRVSPGSPDAVRVAAAASEGEGDRHAPLASEPSR